MRPSHRSSSAPPPFPVCLFFFFNDPAPPEIYTLSLHDALPIFLCHPRARARGFSNFSVPARCGSTGSGRLGGAAAAGGGRDALSYGVSFATTRSHQLARGGALTSFVTVARARAFPLLSGPARCLGCSTGSGRLGGSTAACRRLDALSYGVSFVTTRSHQLARRPSAPSRCCISVSGSCRLGGAAATGGARDALSYGVSFATTRSLQLARGGALTSFVTVARARAF